MSVYSVRLISTYFMANDSKISPYTPGGRKKNNPPCTVLLVLVLVLVLGLCLSCVLTNGRVLGGKTIRTDVHSRCSCLFEDTFWCDAVGVVVLEDC